MIQFQILYRGLLFVLACTLTCKTYAHRAPEEMAEAAAHLLAALTPEQKAKCSFAIQDEERLNWHFIPCPRKGLPLKELTSAQRPLVQALLASGLSQRGYMKAATIMSLEEILKELEQGNGPERDPGLYYLSLFGTPGARDFWGWRVEGHHLSLNFAIGGGETIAVTPSFLGSNPGEVRNGPRQGLRVLGAEEDLARQLVKALDESQRQTAIYTNRAPADIITAADRKARMLAPMGLSATAMTGAQRDLLWSLIREYVYRYRAEIADRDLEKIHGAGLETISFAWAGGVEPGQGHYYRVQGPSFLLEYDNTQNNANHVHSVWRDLKSDFGEDLLGKHYDQDHRKK